MERYRAIWKLNIRHPYYADRNRYIFDVKPTGETSLLMRRRGMIFRGEAFGNWVFYGTETTGFTDDDVIELDVYTNDPCFCYVTDSLEKQSGIIQCVRLNGMESLPLNLYDIGVQEIKSNRGVILKILFSPASNPEKNKSPLYSNELVFKAAERYLEYILLFRDKQDNRTLLLEDLSGKLTFLPAEKTEVAGSPGLRIQSAQKITLSQHPEVSLNLVEPIGTRMRAIDRNVPFPTPGAFEASSPEMLRHIMYV